MAKDVFWIIEQYWVDSYNSPFDQELIFKTRKEAREAMKELKQQPWAKNESFRISQFKRVGGSE